MALRRPEQAAQGGPARRGGAPRLDRDGHVAGRQRLCEQHALAALERVEWELRRAALRISRARGRGRVRRRGLARRRRGAGRAARPPPLDAPDEVRADLALERRRQRREHQPALLQPLQLAPARAVSAFVRPSRVVLRG